MNFKNNNSLKNKQTNNKNISKRFMFCRAFAAVNKTQRYLSFQKREITFVNRQGNNNFSAPVKNNVGVIEVKGQKHLALAPKTHSNLSENKSSTEIVTHQSFNATTKPWGNTILVSNTKFNNEPGKQYLIKNQEEIILVLDQPEHFWKNYSIESIQLCLNWAEIYYNPKLLTSENKLLVNIFHKNYIYILNSNYSETQQRDQINKLFNNLFIKTSISPDTITKLIKS